MLDELRPLMNATVRHHRSGKRSIHGGRPYNPDGFTEHRARVSRAVGAVISRASGEKVSLPSATLWLIDHPRPIDLGHVFEIDPGQPLDVVGLETREIDGRTLTKVYLK